MRTMQSMIIISLVQWICNGGGVCIWKNEVILNANQIYENKGTYGGGLFIKHNSGSSIIENNILKIIVHNVGGGIYLTLPQTQTQIINNTILNDTATYGGGIYTPNISPLIMNPFCGIMRQLTAHKFIFRRKYTSSILRCSRCLGR